MNVGAGRFTGDPLARAVGQCRAAIQAHGEFDAHPGQSLFHALHEPDVEFSSLVLHEPRLNGDASPQQRVSALPAHARVGVLNGKHDARDTRFDQGIGAGRCAAMMAAGLEGDIRRCAGDGLLRRAKCHNFGMRLARALVATFANDAIALGDNTSNPRIGMGCIQASLGESQCPRHCEAVEFSEHTSPASDRP